MDVAKCKCTMEIAWWKCIMEIVEWKLQNGELQSGNV
jgi:hypothetical protein